MRALVTGASSGIGLEFARLLAADNYEVIVVARRGDLLEDLAKQLRTARAIVADLGDRRDIAHVADLVPDVDVLINNAGFGDYGPFADRDMERQLAMIDVNVRAVTELTSYYLPGMLRRGRGRIVNVASTAAFQPGPLAAVYYATKAYVLSFSEALSEETRGTGVTVTTLCPGSTVSGFRAAANIHHARVMDGRRLPSSADVALAGYAAMQAGKSVVVIGTVNRAMAGAIRFLPRPVVRRVVHRLQRPR